MTVFACLHVFVRSGSLAIYNPDSLFILNFLKDMRAQSLGGVFF
jgi:hypothetical protein